MAIYLALGGIFVLIFNTLYWQVVRPARKAARAGAAQVPVQAARRIGRHADAMPVESVTGETVAWLCPACDQQLDADWEPPSPADPGPIEVGPAVFTSRGPIHLGTGNTVTWTVAGDRQPLAMTGGAGGSSVIDLDALRQSFLDAQSRRIQQAVLGGFMTLGEAREHLPPLD